MSGPSTTATGRTPTAEHVVVVGAGLAGLSAAMHLAGAGRRVSVLEATSAPGGCAARVALPATGGGTYQLDTGPTVLTMPDLLADCFAAVGESLSDWVTLRPLDPAYRAQFADGSSLLVTSDVEAMAERIRAFSSAPGRLPATLWAKISRPTPSAQRKIRCRRGGSAATFSLTRAYIFS